MFPCLGGLFIVVGMIRCVAGLMNKCPQSQWAGQGHQDVSLMTSAPKRTNKKMERMARLTPD